MNRLRAGKERLSTYIISSLSQSSRMTMNGDCCRSRVQPLIIWYKIKASYTAARKCKPLNHSNVELIKRTAVVLLAVRQLIR